MVALVASFSVSTILMWVYFLAELAGEKKSFVYPIFAVLFSWIVVVLVAIEIGKVGRIILLFSAWVFFLISVLVYLFLS